MASQLTDTEFQAEVAEFNGVVLIDFWAEWCTPCRIQGPIIDKLAEKYKENPNIKIFKLDVDENPETQGSFHVMSIPTLMFFKDGQPAESMVGLRSEEDIDDKIQELLGN
ncbi:MAG: thioredoxin [Candidatus Dojkabacteria bacterium]|nr:MAG: thioredoxin [Candidatus Dojkabacteria bacterium]